MRPSLRLTKHGLAEQIDTTTPGGKLIFHLMGALAEFERDLNKDTAARMWCENASTLTGQPWRYIKVPQKEYRSLQPVEFEDLLAFSN